MLQFPRVIHRANLSKNTEKIKILSGSVKHLPLTRVQKKHIFHQQVLKSALFSARIEGNQLSLETVKKLDLKNPKEKNKKELSNIIKARDYLRSVGVINEKNLREIHSLVMKELSVHAGKLRQVMGAIYDQQGNAVYLTPDVNTYQKMLEVFYEKVNLTAKSLGEGVANLARCHYYFEKIHPFIDGNGRVGRLIIHWQLAKLRELPDISLPVEEYFDKNRVDYYRLLEANTRQVDDFGLFMSQAITWSLERILKEVKQLSAELESDQTLSLLPRRQEILNIVGDHPHCSLDFIARRFPALSKRMINYDVKVLINKKLVVRHGETKGSVYSRRDK